MKFKKSLDYFRFCPVCGARLALVKLHNRPFLKCQACDFFFFQNSKPTATAFITNDRGRLLFVKRAIQPKLGWWDFPGGFLEEGEDPVAGVKRELREELGVTLKDVKLLGIYMDTYVQKYTMYTLNIIYTASVVSRKMKAMDDVASMKWFAPDTIPWRRLAFPKWMKSAIHDWLKLQK